MRAKRPNILLFLTDEHRLSGVGCYGNTVSQTPNLDRLAQRGLLFRNTYTACPLCSPARASLLTGLHVHAHGMTTNIHEYGCTVNEIPESDRLLSRLLGRAGYRCGYTGKWHLGSDSKELAAFSRFFKIPNTPAYPSTRGFEGQDFPGHGGGGFCYPQYQEYLKCNGWSFKVTPHAADGNKTRFVPGSYHRTPSGVALHAKDGEKTTGYGIFQGPPEATVSWFLADHTISLIDAFAGDDQPFFLWHNDWGPHGEHWVPQEYYDLYKDVEIPEWPSFRMPEDPHSPANLWRHPKRDTLQWQEWEETLRYYYASCTLIDHQLGRILEHLERRGLAENTIVIFSSDHGETLGSHGSLTNKGCHHYEETHRIPLIVSDPRTPARHGHEIQELASQLDIYSTIAEIARADTAGLEMHGSSLMPFLTGTPPAWRDTVFTEFFGLGGILTSMITCRHGRFKYGWTSSNRDELYDLETDPEELTNLIDEPSMAETVRDLRRRMYTFMVDSGYACADGFLRSRLGWNVDKQFLRSKDPEPRESFLCPVNWR